VSIHGWIILGMIGYKTKTLYDKDSSKKETMRTKENGKETMRTKENGKENRSYIDDGDLLKHKSDNDFFQTLIVSDIL
jgi:Asp-tRNA(Asn)/Glu-tRNA(Gln) amidotransferase B subunit